MRITRAAKVAAFPLTALILVALIACQGPVGVTGDKGDKGDKGDPGTGGTAGMDGEPGMDAPIPLTGRVGDIVIDSLNAGTDKDEATEFTIDLHAAGYFNGGEAPFEYKVVSMTGPDGNAVTSTGETSDGLATAEIDEDTNMLKLKLNVGSQFDDPADFMVGFTIAVSAEDANMENASSSVTIKPNRAPRLVTGVSKVDNSDRLSGENAGYVVGTMDDEIDTNGDQAGTPPREDGVALCATMDSCVLELFEDEGDYVITVISNPGGSYSWSDEGEGKLKLTGLAATEEAVDVDVTATDKDGLDIDVRFTLEVNAPPTLADGASELARSITIDEIGSAGARKLFGTTAAAMAAFKDDEDVTVTYKSANEAIVTIGDDSTMTGQAAGTTTVTARGTTGIVGTPDDDGLGQYVEIMFTVTVK